MVENADRDYLVDLFEKRRRVAADAGSEAYYAGRIDGHCLQNAISYDDLSVLAEKAGFVVDWASALEVYAT